MIERFQARYVLVLQAYTFLGQINAASMGTMGAIGAYMYLQCLI